MTLKSRTRSINGLYHEIEVLVTLSLHQNIIEIPQYRLKTFWSVNKKPQACGFLLKHHEAGALQEALPQRLDDGALDLDDQLRWVKEAQIADSTSMRP